MSTQNFAQQNEDDLNKERFQSDTQKIVRRHLENENDIISEDDIKNVRVGLTPPDSEIEMEKKHLHQEIEKVEEDAKDTEEEIKNDDNPITPWDTLER